MSAPFKRGIEPLFTQLLNLKKQAVKLIARQPLGPEEAAPAQQEGDQEDRLTAQEYQVSAETFLQRIQGVISHVKEVNKEWKAFIHSRTPAELQKANDDYFNFLIADADENIHFLTLMVEGLQAIASVEQSLTVLRINQAQIRQAQNQPAVQEQNVPQQPPVELPAEQPEPRKQTQAAAHEAQNAAQQPVAANLLAQPHIQGAQLQPTAPPFEADFAVNRHNGINHHHDANTLQLPRMKPPIFIGDPLQWPTFWDLFEASVHNKPISNAEKMSYLVMSLKDTAEKAIQGYHITNDNYPIVIELLKRRFGNRQAISEMLQSELIALPKATDAIQSLRTLVEF